MKDLCWPVLAVSAGVRLAPVWYRARWSPLDVLPCPAMKRFHLHRPAAPRSTTILVIDYRLSFVWKRQGAGCFHRFRRPRQRGRPRCAAADPRPDLTRLDERLNGKRPDSPSADTNPAKPIFTVEAVASPISRCAAGACFVLPCRSLMNIRKRHSATNVLLEARQPRPIFIPIAQPPRGRDCLYEAAIPRAAEMISTACGLPLLMRQVHTCKRL